MACQCCTPTTEHPEKIHAEAVEPRGDCGCGCGGACGCGTGLETADVTRELAEIRQRLAALEPVGA